jgi:regulator of sigma E protease
MIGFGPTLFSRRRGETEFGFKAVPLGGYVAMFGEEVSMDGLNIPKERSLLGISKPKRAVIMSAGVILNFVLAYLLFFLSNVGFTQQQFTNQLNVSANSLGEIAGLRELDALDLTSLSNETFIVETLSTHKNVQLTLLSPTSFSDTFDDLLIFRYRDTANQWVRYQPISSLDFASFQLPILRNIDGELTPIRLDMTLPAIASDDAFVFASIGAEFFIQTTNYNFSQALQVAWSDWTRGVSLIFTSVIGLLSGQNFDQVGGIVAIFSTSSSVLSNLGLGTYIFLWGLISVNLAIFNLLPFPGLDGWHLLVIAIEGVMRKEIPSRLKNILSFIGFMILMTLMVFLIFRDLGFLIALL